jgi:hypothetical protein
MLFAFAGGLQGCTPSSKEPVASPRQKPSITSGVPTTTASSTSTTTAADPPPVYRLGKVPREFSVEKLGVPVPGETFVVTAYERASTQDEGFDTLRVSVVARRHAAATALSIVPTVGIKVDTEEVTLRDGKEGLFFRVANRAASSRNRHGVVWEEDPGLYIEVYGFMDRAALLAVAESAMPAS